MVAKILLDPIPQKYPPISVIMPVLNEAAHLENSVRRVLDQEYPGSVEIILALGPSSDETNSIAEKIAAEVEAKNYSEESNSRQISIALVENPTGATPVGLNLAIEKAKNEIVVRVDAHAELCSGYLAKAVQLLNQTGAANVGGLMDAKGRTDFEKAVACAYNSKLGLGGGGFHLKQTPAGSADTVFLGCFRKSALTQVGGFDPSLRRAQDWELNYRLRQAGYLIWFSPDLQVTYRPRSTVKALAKQFFKTGQWRREVIRRYPQTASMRYLAPPAVVLATGASFGLGLLARKINSALLAKFSLLAPMSYLGGIIFGSATIKEPLTTKSRVLLPLVLAVMHLSWGAGFLRGVPKDQR